MSTSLVWPGQAVARGDNAEALSRYVRVLASRPAT